MIRKYIYKVKKSFILTKDQENEYSISEDPDENSGTSFSKGEKYVDYKSLKEGIAITVITETLIKKGFLKLISKVEL